MLGDAPGDPDTPHLIGRILKLRAHQRLDLFFVQPKLSLDRLKGRTIFPGHLDDS